MKTKSPIAIAVLLASASLAHAAPLAWREVAPGMAYTRIVVGPAESPGYLHAFKIEPARYRLDVIMAKDMGSKTATVREMANGTKALLTINGGFFSPELEPLGLRIQSGRERSSLKSTSWWGVFFLNEKSPQIAARSDFAPGNGIRMAVQSGPRLVVNGSIPQFKSGTAERSAIGIARNGNIIIVATEQAPIELAALAQIFRKAAPDGGLDCPNALNLDGGGSSQIYARPRGFTLDVPGFTPVTDAVAVFPK